MKNTLSLLLLSLQLLFAQELFFSRQAESWVTKNNATVSASAEAVRAEVDTTRYNFTWWRTSIPPCDYGQIQGFTGRVRLVSGENDNAQGYPESGKGIQHPEGKRRQAVSARQGDGGACQAVGPRQREGGGRRGGR